MSLAAELAALATRIGIEIKAVRTTLAGYVPTTRTIGAGTGLSGGGDLSANRTLAVAYGTAAGTAAQGNDARLSDTRTPTDGTVTNAKVAAAAAIAESKLSLASDAAAGTASRRTLGTGSTQAAAGNHAHVADGARRHRIISPGGTTPLSLGFNAITFNNTTFTRGTAVTAGTNSLTVNVAGVFLVGMVATFSHATNSGFRSSICQVNGVTAFEGGVGGVIVRMPMTAPLVLAAGDVLTMQVYIDTTTCNLQANGPADVALSAIYLGP